MLRPALLAIAIAIALPATFPALAQQPAATAAQQEASRISVRGEGVVYRAPDLAVLSLTVMRRAETSVAATEEAGEAIAVVTAAIAELGVERRDLQTAGFQIAPQYRNDDRDGTATEDTGVIAYEVRNNLTVKVRDLSRVGEILDRAVQEGVNEDGSISFQIEDDREAAAEARREAVEDARLRAETLAVAAGLTLGRIVTIEDGPMAAEPFPSYGFERMGAAGAASAIPIETGENAVWAEVRIVYELVD